MKKIVFLLVLSIYSLAAWAYDFSAVAPTGQTLYYNITSSTSSYTVSVTYPLYSRSNYNYYYGYTQPTGSLTIPSTVTYSGRTYSVTSIGEWAFWYCSGLISITIPNSVTSIGDHAFIGCSGLTSVTIPNSVTSIGDVAFYNCSGLTSVTIPNSVTSIGGSAFYNCSGLTSVTIPNSVTAIGNAAFYGCSGLTEIISRAETAPTLGSGVFDYVPTNIPVYIPCGSSASYQSGWTSFSNFVEGGYDFSAVASTGQRLYYHITSTTNNTVEVTYPSCSSGSSGWNGYTKPTGALTIPSTVSYSGTTYSVTSIGGYAFAYCSGLTGVTIPNSVTAIGNYAFEYCSGLTSVTIPNSVTSIGDNAFIYCSGLTSVTIPNSVTSIGGGAFYECRGLTSVTIPNSVTSIGSSAFADCSGLTSVTIPNSVTSIGIFAFGGCSGLASLVVETGNTVYDSRENCNAIIETATNTLIAGTKNTVIPNSVTAIENSAFRGCSGLTSVTILNSVTSIGEWAFCDCSGLTSVTIPNSVTSIGEGTFWGCNGLTSVTIPNSVTSIGSSAFYSCSGLTSVTIPNSVTAIGNGAFWGCSGLTSVTIPNSVTSIGNSAFYYCSGLTSVTIPNSVTAIGNAAFYGCSGLTEIISRAETAPTLGGSSVFTNVPTNIPVYIPCNGSLDSYQARWLRFSNFVEGGYDFSAVASTGQRLYYHITSTTSNTVEVTYPSCSPGSSGWNGYTKPTGALTIPSTVSYSGTTYSVTSIGSNAFYDCYGLTSVTIPNSVTSIGEWAFAHCRGLTSVTIPNSVTSIGYAAFYSCSGLTSVTIPNSVTSIGVLVFRGCSGLTSLVVGTTNSVYDSRNNCNAIIETATNTLIAGTKNTVIPNSVTSIGNYAFNSCSGLTSITIPNSVTSIEDYAFYGCNHLTEIISRAETAPTLGSGVFDYVPTDIPVYIPCNGNLDSYQARWLRFSNFVGGIRIRPQDLPYTEDFDTYTSSTTAKTGLEPTCWTLAHRDVSMTEAYVPMIYYSAANAHSGSYSLILNKRGIYAMPRFEDDVRMLQLDMYVKQGERKYQLVVGVMEDLDDATTFVPVATIDNATTASEQVRVDFGSYTGTGHYIAFRNVLAPGNSGDYSCNYIDDITLGLAEGVTLNETVIGSETSTTTGRYPVNNYYNYTLSETIVDATEMAGGAQTLTSLSLYYNYATPTTRKTNCTVYVQHTTRSTFASSSDIEALSADAVMVYAGPMNCSQGWNTFAFDNEFAYDGTSNLLIIVDDNSGSYDGSSYVFKTSPCEGRKTLSWYSDGTNPDISNTAAFSSSKGYYADRCVMKLGGHSVTLPCPKISLPYTEDFDGYTTSTTAKTGVEPTCWTLAHEYVAMTDEYRPMIYYSAANAHSGSYSLLLNKRGIYAMPEYDGEVNTLQLSMYVKQSNAAYQLEVGVMSDLEDEGTFVPVATINNATTNSEFVTVDFGGYTGSGKHIAFRNTNSSATSVWGLNYIDDLTLELIPEEPEPECGIRIADLPYTDNFDGYTTSTTAKTGVEPTCWTLAHKDVSYTDEYRPMIYYDAANAHSGSYSLILNKRGIYAMPEYEGEVNTLQLSMYVKQSSTSYQLQVGVMSDLDNASTFVPVATINNATTASELVSVSFAGYTGSGKHIAFRNTNSSATSVWGINYIDDLTLELIPEEPEPECGIRIADLPYTDNFDSYTTSTTAKTGVEPTCWTLAHQDVAMTDEYKPMIYYAAENAHSGSYSLILNKRGIYAMPEYEGEVNTLQLSMYVKQSSTAYRLQVGVMSDLDDETTFVPVATIDNATTASELVSVSFAGYTGSGKYIAFRNTNSSATSVWGINYIDDLTLELIPEEPEPECGIRIADLPYTDNFDSYTTSTTAKTGVEPTCWTLAHQDVAMTDEYKPMIYYAAENAHSGSYSLILNKRGIYAMPEYEGDVNTLQLSMYVKQSNTAYQLQVGVMSDLDDASTFVPVATVNNATTDAEFVTVDFSGYTGSGKRIAFRNTNSSATNVWGINYIDDLTLYLAPEVVTYTITAVANDDAMGVVTGSGEYEAGTEATLTAVPYYGHRFVRWNDGDVSNPRTVTVTATKTYTAVFEAAAVEAVITMVTVDNNRNRIYWDAVDGAASYKVYREENMSGNFVLVGTASAPATDWTDNSADPSVRAFRYRISYTDVRNVESPMSEAHKTMHLTISKGLDSHTWNLIWTEYEGMEYDSYEIYRGSSASSMTCIDVIPAGGYTTYTDANAGTGTVLYQIAIVHHDDLSKGGSDMPKSNIARYERPSEGYVIETAGDIIAVTGCEHKTVRLFDISGRLIDSEADAANVQELRVRSAGVYFVQVGNDPAQKVVVIGR